ncbi:HAD-IA family hydrolase [Streptomyces sp. NPDC001876]|uniref:HAD-IA family hydrolase n=1 Tax=Streptomyces sp. NPDC001876 TaxID=3154402 RepID=UPI0033197786
MGRQTRRYGLLGAFDHVITRESAPRAKPAPDLCREALPRLGLSPHEEVSFEDSPPGLQAARAADIRCVAVAGAATHSKP